MNHRRFLRTLTVVVLIGFGLFLLIASRVHAEQPVRLVVTLNCDDIRAIAQWNGWAELERRAGAAGASQAAIRSGQAVPREVSVLQY